MKDHVSHFVYLALGIIILLFVTGSGIFLVKQGRGIFNNSIKLGTEEVSRRKRNDLMELETYTSPKEVPMAVVKSLYFESGLYIMNMYNCSSPAEVKTNIDEGDINYDELDSRSIKLINEIDSHTKVKLGVVTSSISKNLYDIYIHDIRCKGAKDHTGTCKSLPENNGDDW